MFLLPVAYPLLPIPLSMSCVGHLTSMTLNDHKNRCRGLQPARHGIQATISDGISRFYTVLDFRFVFNHFNIFHLFWRHGHGDMARSSRVPGYTRIPVPGRLRASWQDLWRTSTWDSWDYWELEFSNWITTLWRYCGWLRHPINHCRHGWNPQKKTGMFTTVFKWWFRFLASTVSNVSFGVAITILATFFCLF